MRKRRALWVCVAAALGLGFVAGLAVLVACRPGGVRRASVERIKEGMTEGEVEAIFGGSADRVPTVALSLDVPGRPVRCQKTWSGRDGVAVVAFDPEGTVVWKS